MNMLLLLLMRKLMTHFQEDEDSASITTRSTVTGQGSKMIVTTVTAGMEWYLARKWRVVSKRNNNKVY